MPVDSRALEEVQLEVPGVRLQRKARTHRALLDAALELLADQGFGSLSLRQVAKRAGVVPTAFYRHFDSMDALGVELVDEAIGTLRTMIRAARDEDLGYQEVITHSVRIFVRHVTHHPAHFRFISRERSGGVAPVRAAIRAQLGLFVAELAADLRGFPVFTEWPTEDRRLLAEIISNHMVLTAEAILESGPDEADEAVRRGERQMRMIVIGLSGWRERYQTAAVS